MKQMYRENILKIRALQRRKTCLYRSIYKKRDKLIERGYILSDDEFERLYLTMPDNDLKVYTNYITALNELKNTKEQISALSELI